MAVPAARANRPLDKDFSVLDMLNTSVVLLDSKLRIIHLNQAAELLTGTSIRQVLLLQLDSLFDSGPEIAELCIRVLEQNGSMGIRELELVSLNAPEQRLDVDITISPIESGGVLMELRNIADRLRIKRDRELHSQNTVSRTIIRQLAHEIKNPLGGVRGAAQLLSRRLPSPDLQEYTDVIISETDRLVNLVDAMLGPNRPTHRKLMNLHKVLDHVVKLTAIDAPAEVTVSRDYDPSLPELLIDEDQMTQAILNLVRNAIQAVGKSGIVILRTRVEPSFTLGETKHALVARVDIVDSGQGVPKDLREQIFYPLVTGRVDGVGLGLAITLDLAHRHDGLIKLQPGSPTTFSLYLPIAAPKEVASPNE